MPKFSRKNKAAAKDEVDFNQRVYECIVGTRLQARSNDETYIHDMAARLGRSTSGKQVFFYEKIPGVKKPNLLFTWKDGQCHLGVDINNV